MSNAVLIVDDEKNVLQSLKRLLRGEGFDLYLADGGLDALDILKKTEIAVIVCDQRMPDMSGAQVLAEAYRLQPDAVRITLTGHTDLLAAQASINEGHVSHFLFKPWDDEHFRGVVRKSVESYNLVRENRRLDELSRKQQEELQSWSRQLEEQVREKTEGLRKQNENLQTLERQLDRSLRDTVKLVSGMLEVNSPNLGIHCKRVAELARTLAIRLELDKESVREVEIAAQLHDVGKLSKLAADTSPRNRMGNTTKSPRQPTHTEAGFALLSQVSGFEKIALAVRHQHECFDGTGIPDGLKADKIPLASRIIAITNAYDKAVFSAIHPTDISHRAGARILQQGKGAQFDPHLIELLLQYIKENGANIHRQSEVEISTRKIRSGMVLTRPVRNIEGLLMLKAGTSLTADLVETLHSLGEVDPHVKSVFVKCEIDKDDQPINLDVNEPSANRHRSEENENGECTVEQPVEPSSKISARSGSHRVLLVDDSILLCNALKRELRSADIEVEATENGWTALRLVETTRYDAVLVDLMMPAMPGEELVTRLEKTAPELPCIIITGNATRERVLSLTKKTNVAAILVKPWEHDRLISTIMVAFAKSHS